MQANNFTKYKAVGDLASERVVRSDMKFILCLNILDGACSLDKGAGQYLTIWNLPYSLLNIQW
jgi:hypothetical protein